MSSNNPRVKIKVGIVDDHTLFKNAMKKVLSLYNNLQIVLEADNGWDLFEKLVC